VTVLLDLFNPVVNGIPQLADDTGPAQPLLGQSHPRVAPCSRPVNALSTVNTLLLRTAGTLLLVIGVVKVVSAFSGVRYLAEPDPVLWYLSNRFVLLGAGLTELGLSTVLLLKPQQWYARQALLALCTTFAVYRVGLYSLPTRPPCPCLGRASDWLHLTPQQADLVALVLLVLLGCIGLISVAVHRKVCCVPAAAARDRTKEVH